MDYYVRSVFTEDKFNVVESNGKYIISTDEKHCLTITITQNEIHVNELEKCRYRGTELLFLVEELAKIMDIPEITLSDGSNIKNKCDTFIGLTEIKLLTKGESWYNSLGYVSTNYEQEKRHNLTITKMPFIKTMELVANKLEKQFIQNHNQEDMNRRLSRFQQKLLDLIEKETPTRGELRAIEITTRNIQRLQENLLDYNRFIENNILKIQKNIEDLVIEASELLPDISMETGEYINELYKLMNMFHDSDEESCNKYRIFSRLLFDISKVLMYDPSLRKMIKKTGGKVKTIKKKQITRRRRFYN